MTFVLNLTLNPNLNHFGCESKSKIMIKNRIMIKSIFNMDESISI